MMNIEEAASRRLRIVFVIDGHDWRYTGAGWAWDVTGAGWDALKRVGYSRKECMTCGFIGAPDAHARPCHELWSERTGSYAVAEWTKENNDD